MSSSTIIGLSPQCYIPSFMTGSGEDFWRVFTLYRHGGHLGHVTWTPQTLSFPHPMDAPHEIWLPSAQWFQRRCLKMLTDDRLQMTITEASHTISSPVSQRLRWANKIKTRGPWWSYIAHLTKQICILTVEVSAKFTALGFLYKLYSTNHPHHHTPGHVFLQILTTWTES